MMRVFPCLEPAVSDPAGPGDSYERSVSAVALYAP